MTTRRSFMASILAAAAAPVIVKASALMPIYAPKPWAPFDMGMGDFTIESWVDPYGGLLDEYRITKGDDPLYRGIGQLVELNAGAWQHFTATSSGFFIAGQIVKPSQREFEVFKNMKALAMDVLHRPGHPFSGNMGMR